MASYDGFKKINTEAIVDGTVTSSDLGPGSIDTDEIQDLAVSSSKFQTGAVESAKLGSTLDLSAKTMTYRPVVNADISNSAAIAGGKLASGAAETNLGYTPLRTDGSNTMSGNLRLRSDGGRVTNPAVRGSDSNTGMYFGGTDDLRFTVNSADVMIMDSSGRVREPNKPAFAACGTPGWLYSNSFGGTGWRELSSAMSWSVSHQYGGSNFSNSNGRYTAPVSGWYHFSTMYYYYNNTNGTNSYCHHMWARNGSVTISPSSRNPYVINMHGNTNSHDDGACYNTIMYLNAGQYCSIYNYFATGNSRLHAGHQVFSGQLVG